MTCTYCGASLEPGTVTCPVCGNAVEAGGERRDEPAVDAREPVWSSAADGGAGAGPNSGSGWERPASPHPSGLSSELRTWGMAAHVSTFAAFVGLPVVGPLLVWLLKREEPFVDHHGKEALNFNLSLLIYSVIAGAAAIPLGILTVGIGLIPLILLGLVLMVFWLVCPIVGAVKASNGEGYRYPLTMRLVR